MLNVTKLDSGTEMIFIYDSNIHIMCLNPDLKEYMPYK